MKEPLTHFVLLVAVAKVTRYLAVAAVSLNWA
ncbi:membrane protein YqaA with SNARE-associated domain [Sinorhizobium meliloti]|nr:membrane protein YqaA with SNARE-associated domain [Sinorhizobium meliloti]